jgi:thiamine biosynthesis protein ThiI
MFRIAEEIAKKIGTHALITGEAVGQVASQTIINLSTIAASINTLVLRPLAGLDKEEVIKRARDIGTFDISIEQVPDSCTVFAPNSPATAAPIDKIEIEEKKLDIDQLLNDVIEETMNAV